MKKKGLVGTIIATVMIGVSVVMPIWAATEYYTPFGAFSMTPSTHLESSVMYLTQRSYSTIVKFSSLTTEGYHYIGFLQQLADGTYGGKSGQHVQVTRLTMMKSREFEVAARNNKEYITGDTVVGNVSQVTLKSN